uniref:30S ribosomal protein S9, chloroplastic n=1 Tax=Aegilops tauschii subsp. strangulata TaxID=200361 RepID=A0A453AUC1_AEGTS
PPPPLPPPPARPPDPNHDHQRRRCPPDTASSLRPSPISPPPRPPPLAAAALHLRRRRRHPKTLGLHAGLRRSGPLRRCGPRRRRPRRSAARIERRRRGPVVEGLPRGGQRQGRRVRGDLQGCGRGSACREEGGPGRAVDPWTWDLEDEKDDPFAAAVLDVGLEGIADEGAQIEELVDRKEEDAERQRQEDKAREQQLMETLKGPDRAFGDLISASGITEEMIDSLILLKDARGIPGLPPLSEIQDRAIQKMNATSSRAEVERQMQEEIAKARVRQVDEKGRAYGTGKRKCSIARVWIQPGDGKFVVNDKQFDAYFPILDHRADLLRPFTVTKTLGLWDVACTVKGGGVSGQVGAVRLGISRALQNWEPGLRPYLKAAGYLTRDSRVVERKKPGKAKARKSFQWVKR